MNQYEPIQSLYDNPERPHRPVIVFVLTIAVLLVLSAAAYGIAHLISAVI